MSRSHKRRELARAIRQRRRATQWESSREDVSHQRRVLSELDAFGILDRLQRKAPENLLCFGPKLITSPLDKPEPWAGVVVWYRPSGYHNYQRLTLLGIWVEGQHISPKIIVGRRALRYGDQPYNPESYFYHLQRDFAVYYDGDSGPPNAADSQLIVEYSQTQRIEIRRQIEAIVNQWQGDGT